MQPTSAQPELIPIPRSLQFALFLTGLLWLITARSVSDRASTGIATYFAFSQYTVAFLSELFFLFLILTGFSALSFIATRSGGIRVTNALPNRPTAAREWQLGVVIGWGTVLLLVLPMILAGDMQPTFWLTVRSILLTLLTTATIALSTLALEVAYRGFLFRRLIGAIGATFATILISAVYALLISTRVNTTPTIVLTSFLFGIFLSIAYLRTHAIWLGWGLHFAWVSVMGIALGLPVAGLNSYSTIVDTNTAGSAFLTGGPYGPEAAPFTVLCLLAAITVLYHSTRDYAWNYTHAEILPAGAAVVIAPPAAHVEMENASASKTPLIQIQSTTAANSSTMAAVEDHLRDLKKQRDNIP